MSKSLTKDERFVVTAYEAAMKKDDLHAKLDRYKVGASCGLSPKAVDTICNLLAQANFIKKTSDVEMYLTQNGVNLALTLRGQ